MPKVTALGATFEVEEGKRLILALRDEDIDILHRCGGFAACTTCRVTFEAGEPEKMTQAELTKLQGQDGLGEYRLSCQIACDADMSVTPLMSLESEGLDSRGGRPQDSMTPDPVWVEKP